MEKETPLLCLRVLKIKTLTAIQPTSKHSIEVNMARSHSVPYVRLTAFKAQRVICMCAVNRDWRVGAR